LRFALNNALKSFQSPLSFLLQLPLSLLLQLLFQSPLSANSLTVKLL
jgi:hypothetical protein